MNAQEPTRNETKIKTAGGGDEIRGETATAIIVDEFSKTPDAIIDEISDITICPTDDAGAPGEIIRVLEAPVRCDRCDKPLNEHKGWPEWCPTKPHGQAGSAKYGE